MMFINDNIITRTFAADLVSLPAIYALCDDCDDADVQKLIRSDSLKTGVSVYLQDGDSAAHPFAHAEFVRKLLQQFVLQRCTTLTREQQTSLLEFLDPATWPTPCGRKVKALQWQVRSSSPTRLVALVGVPVAAFDFGRLMVGCKYSDALLLAAAQLVARQFPQIGLIDMSLESLDQVGHTGRLLRAL